MEETELENNTLKDFFIEGITAYLEVPSSSKLAKEC
jgi:hypothetical protein